MGVEPAILYDEAYEAYGGGYRAYRPTSSCAIFSIFEVPAIIVLVCLAIITARSARLIRLIENHQPEIPLLPPQKMVVLDRHIDGNAVMLRTVVAAVDCVVHKESIKTELGSEQNV